MSLGICLLVKEMLNGNDEWVMSAALRIKLWLIWRRWVLRMGFLFKNLFFYWQINDLLAKRHRWNLTGYKNILFCIDIGYQYQFIDTGLILHCFSTNYILIKWNYLYYSFRNVMFYLLLFILCKSQIILLNFTMKANSLTRTYTALRAVSTTTTLVLQN